MVHRGCLPPVVLTLLAFLSTRNKLESFLERETSVEVTLSDWQVGKSVGAFSIVNVEGPSPVDCKQWQPWAGGPGLYK